MSWWTINIEVIQSHLVCSKVCTSCFVVHLSSKPLAKFSHFSAMSVYSLVKSYQRNIIFCQLFIFIRFAIQAYRISNLQTQFEGWKLSCLDFRSISACHPCILKGLFQRIIAPDILGCFKGHNIVQRSCPVNQSF